MIRFLFKAVVILGLLGFAIIGGYAVVTGESPNEIDTNALGNLSIIDDAEDDDPNQLYEDGVLTRSDVIDEIRVTGFGELQITFEDDHNADGWAIIHEHHDDPSEQAIVHGETPDFAGPITVDLDVFEPIEQYPTRGFTLVIWDGESLWRTMIIESERDRIDFEFTDDHDVFFADDWE